MRIRFLLVSAVASLAVALSPASAGAAIVTVGSPLTQTFKSTQFKAVGLVANSVLPEAGAHITSPISGTIIRWRVVDASGGPFRLQVLRPGANDAYTGVGISSPQTLQGGAGTQTVPANLPILAGDTIGIENSTANVDSIGIAQPVTGSTYVAWVPTLADGATAPPAQKVLGTEVGFNADVQPLPTITSISPASSSFKGGASVTITGTDFTGATAVSFGSVPATSFTVNSDTQITAVSPATAPGVSEIAVTTLAGTTAKVAGDQFTSTACIVPKLSKKKLKAAKKKLKAAGCTLGKVKKTGGATSKSGKISKQKPKSGTVLDSGSKVKVTLKP